MLQYYTMEGEAVEVKMADYRTLLRGCTKEVFQIYSCAMEMRLKNRGSHC